MKIDPADCDSETVDEALKAIIDGKPRVIIPLTIGSEYEGTIWEIYRSIGTPSVRIRICDDQGRVHHYNSLDVDIRKRSQVAIPR
jgi:hypothetical protein